MRAQHEITHHPYITDGFDSYGDLVVTDGAPKLIKAYSIAPRVITEVDRIITIGLTVALPQSFGIKPGDRISIGDVTYHVDGPLTDCNLGFGRYKPGFIMYLTFGGDEYV